MLAVIAMARGCGAERNPVCPPGETASGIDVSHWQGAIDWERVAPQVDFAIARVSDGASVPDSRFADNWPGIADAGLVRGAYQFFRAAQSPERQADLLVGAIADLDDGDLSPVLDLETADGVAADQVADAALRWLRRVEDRTGRVPTIYTNPSFWRTLPNPGAFARYGLWIANWGVDCPDVPRPWSGWQIWQTSDDGRIDGIDGAVDLDRELPDLIPSGG